MYYIIYMSLRWNSPIHRRAARRNTATVTALAQIFMFFLSGLCASARDIHLSPGDRPLATLPVHGRDVKFRVSTTPLGDQPVAPTTG